MLTMATQRVAATPTKEFYDFEGKHGDDDEEEEAFLTQKYGGGENPTFAKLRDTALTALADLQNTVQKALDDGRVDKKKVILGIIGFSLFLNFFMMIRLASRKPSVYGWVRPNKIFGLVRVAMTGDTEINRQLALKYERVCGNSAYSFDSYTAHERSEGFTAGSTNDAVAQLYGPGHDRGRLPDEWMADMGFEDCDYIAWAVKSSKLDQFGSEDLPIELHVPCPDPLTHLMEQCHHQHNHFDCEASDLSGEVEKCLEPSIDKRFQDNLVQNPYMTLKCFDPALVTRYVDFMGTILQPKRAQIVDYVHQGMKPRDEDNECIWDQNEEFKQEVLRILNEKTIYYPFCEKCTGSNDELPL